LITCLGSLPVAAQEVATQSSPTLPGLMPPTLDVKSSRFDDDDDRAVRRALEKRITLRLDSVPLNEAVRRLGGELGIPILIDPEGLEEAGVVIDQVVSFQLPNARARNALKLLLEPLNLTIDVTHGVLQITSVEKASEHVITRVYNVRDLVQTGSRSVGFALPVPQTTRVYYGGFASDGGEWNDFDTLIDLITSTVQPDAWTDNGGQGSISGFPRGALLVVGQTEDIHEELQELLKNMRSATDRVGAILP
jgi:hypothetical protein